MEDAVAFAGPMDEGNYYHMLTSSVRVPWEPLSYGATDISKELGISLG
jgi:hypothetical protein